MDPSPEQKGDILIVDDNPVNLDLLSNMLMDRQYRVRVATNGRRALAAARSRPPDLVMLDINMPEMDGFEVGGADYVTKPFQFEEVLARIENQLKLSRLQRDLARKNAELTKKNDEL